MRKGRRVPPARKVPSALKVPPPACQVPPAQKALQVPRARQVLPDDPAEARRLLGTLSTQLTNYMGQAGYRGVVVEWVGAVPISVQAAVTGVGAQFPGKLCQIVGV